MRGGLVRVAFWAMLGLAASATAAAAQAPAVSAVPDDAIFGFTSPTGLGKAGDTGIALETTTRAGKGSGRFTSSVAKLEFSRTLTDDVWIAGSAFGLAHRIARVDGIDVDRRVVAFEGMSGELAVRVLRRTEAFPVAVTLSIEPGWSRHDGTTAAHAEGFASEQKIFVDMPLIADRLFVAANASWLAGVQRSSDPGSPWQRGSGATLSAAITLSLGSVFVGAEIRSLSAFNGTFLNQQVGRALYAGPNMLWKVNETVSANLAVTPQVNGHARGRPDRTVDLDNFERSQVRARVAFSF